jgi:hippurate hydrolase
MISVFVHTVKWVMIRHMRSTTLLVILALFTLSTRAADTDQIKAQIDKQYADLEKLYLHFHTHPELSHQEMQTAKRLADELRAAGYDVTERVGGNGVVAVLKNGEGKTLLLRTELDALPVKENTNVDYASTVTATDRAGRTVPVMHACGHDIHLTGLVGSARILAAMKDRWHGTLVLIGQPAEETVAGASAMLKDGLFTRFPRPDFCLAQHCDAELQAGKVGYVSGFAMANVDTLDIVIKGVGGHGAWPHKTKDPVVIAAQTIINLQTIVSREIKPTDPAVVTVGSIHGGTKHNIIPDQVTLQLTVRTYKDEVREQVLKSIERIVKGTALTAGVPTELEPTITRTDESTPATYNTPALVDRTIAHLRTVLGDDNLVEREPAMGAEDFGLFGRTQHKIPIFMFRLGTVSPERIAAAKSGGPPLPSLHSSGYLPQKEATLRTGVLAMTTAAIDLLSK